MVKTTHVWDSLKEGTELPAITKTPTYMQLFMFSAITWNRHLIHFNAEYAKHDGLQNVAVHRALLGNFLAQLLTNWIGESGRLTKLEWNVRASAQPGDALLCRGKVIRKITDGGIKQAECEIWIEKIDGTLIAPGKAKVVFF